MNSLVIFPSELYSKDLAIIENKRAEKVLARHKLEKDRQIKIVVFNKSCAEGVVVEVTPHKIKLSLKNFQEVKKESTVKAYFIIGVCRPQFVRRIIESASIFRVEGVFFVRTE
ncbi:MAG: hypothetical protein D6780_00015, partial [Candidatus Dadabacteria bacterium]